MDRRERGLETLRRMLPAETVAETDRVARSDAFAANLNELTISHAFGEVWARPGLDLRSRSLVTVGILIALRAETELKAHLAIARSNGVTLEEIEEIIYQASVYAGYPAAMGARRAALAAISEAAPEA